MNMEIFRNSEFGSIRVIEEDGKYLFCGSEWQRPWGTAIPERLSVTMRGVERNVPSPPQAVTRQ